MSLCNDLSALEGQGQAVSSAPINLGLDWTHQPAYRSHGHIVSAEFSILSAALWHYRGLHLGLVDTLDVLELGLAVQLGLHVGIVQDAPPQPSFIKQGTNARYEQEGDSQGAHCAPQLCSEGGLGLHHVDGVLGAAQLLCCSACCTCHTCNKTSSWTLTLLPLLRLPCPCATGRATQLWQVALN